MKSLAVPTLQATAQTEEGEKKLTLQFIVACWITAHLITPFLCEGIIAWDIIHKEKRELFPPAPLQLP